VANSNTKNGGTCQRTTKLDDRRDNQITLSAMERIAPAERVTIDAMMYFCPECAFCTTSPLKLPQRSAEGLRTKYCTNFLRNIKSLEENPCN
jgi:hypothetical protein